MFCFRSILQIWIILIGFRDTNYFMNLGICKHEFKFTCRGYFRFTLTTTLLMSMQGRFSPISEDLTQSHVWCRLKNLAFFQEFFQGGKICCYAIAFGPNFRRGKKSPGGRTASGGALPPVEESQKKKTCPEPLKNCPGPLNTCPRPGLKIK